MITVRKLGRLNWYVYATIFNSSFTALTIFGPAFIFFLSDLGLDKARIGVLLALIPFAGIVAPFAASGVGRYGLKRAFILFWSLRKVAFAAIFLVPFILRTAGADAAFYWVAGLILAFSIFRGLAETGFYPWLQELIPNDIRGKFNAINNIAATVVTMIIAAVSSFVVGQMTGIDRFMILFAFGLLFGILGVIAYAMLPGGAPLSIDTAGASRNAEMRQALRDSNFMRFLFLGTLITLGASLGGTFVALYLSEEIGISAGSVVLLSIGASVGALVSAFPFGWAADRYGSRPMMVIGLAASLVGPIGMLLMPSNSPISLPFAMLLSFLGAVAGSAWGAGAGRYLFVTAVPRDKSTGYMAVSYAWNAIVGGSGPLIAGGLLSLLENLHSSGVISISAYAPLFIINALTLLGGVFLANQMRDSDAVPLREIARNVFRTRPPRNRYLRMAYRNERLQQKDVAPSPDPPSQPNLPNQDTQR